MMRKPRVYICHPFTEKTITQEKANRQSSYEWALKVAKRRLMPKNPLTMFGLLTPTQMEHAEDLKITRKDIMRECLADLQRCDAILMCPGWQDSKGCRKELRLSRNLGMPVLLGEDALDRYAQKFRPGGDDNA